MSAYSKHKWIHIKEDNENTKKAKEAAEKEAPAIEESENKEKKKLEEALLESTNTDAVNRRDGNKSLQEVPNGADEKPSMAGSQKN